MDLNSQLLQFIARSPSAFHAVENVKDALAAAGFRELYETEAFAVKPGDKVFVRRNGSSLIALKIPEGAPAGLMLAAAHSDSPSFKIKENAPVDSPDGYVRLNAEKIRRDAVRAVAGPAAFRGGARDAAHGGRDRFQACRPFPARRADPEFGDPYGPQGQ